MSGTDIVKKAVKEYIESINNCNLFSFNEKNYVDEKLDMYVDNIHVALTNFGKEDFLLASSVAWESVRRQVCNGDYLSIWEEAFYEINTIIDIKVENNQFCKYLCGFSVFDNSLFKSLLPFTGCLAEIISSYSGIVFDYFTRQVRYYYKGLWVCGWVGARSGCQFLYPTGHFYIYNGGV